MACDIDNIPQFTADEIELQFGEMCKKYDAICGGVHIKTPWDNLNNLFNDWLKYQTNMGSRWARVRHNGMCDLTSDSECLGCFAADLAAERLRRVMTYQYSNGYCPRTFLDGAIQDKGFSDNMVWMVFAAHAITKELGDINYLLRETKFNDDTSATVYDHTYFKTCGEPYVMFNSYMGLETGYRAGTPGQSWRTAAGQWLLYSVVRFIYGLTPEFEGLRIRPCLPPSWKDCSITKKFRDCTYNVHFVGSGIVQGITVNGKNHDIKRAIAPTHNGELNIEVILG